MNRSEKLLHQACFDISVPEFRLLPPDTGLEIAFAGRSNCGKSTAINTLCNQRSLARTSRTPGRTQLMNFFKLNGEIYFVDLPGYGFAKAPKAVQASFLGSDRVHLAGYAAEQDDMPRPGVWAKRTFADPTVHAAYLRADLRMRIRVAEFTPVRAIAELNDGSLHMSRQFVKVLHNYFAK